MENEGGGWGYDLSKGESTAGYVGEYDRNVPEDNEVDQEEPAEVEWEEPAEVHTEVHEAEPVHMPRDQLQPYNRADGEDNDDDDDEWI